MHHILHSPWGVAVALLATLLDSPTCVVAVPSVNVGMKASFPSPPYLLELL
jgi:UDP-glucose:glycoprotein glucosyltransferase